MNSTANLLLSLGIQIPIVVAFIWFVLQQDKGQRQANRETHELWAGWLSRREEAMTATWKEIDQRQAAERIELLKALSHVESQLAHLSKLTLLIYTAVNRESPVNPHVIHSPEDVP